MRLNQILNWIVVAIAIVVLILLLDIIFGLVMGLAKAAIPILVSLFLVGLVLRFIGSRRTR